MRAIQIDRVGPPEVMQLVERELPVPGPSDVRVRHSACGVNYIDTYHRTGLYPVPLPAVLGTEGAGVVDAIGADVQHVAIGDRVAYQTRSLGSYAEARIVPAIHVVKLPDAIDFVRAAALMLKGLTVQYLLRRLRVVPRSGDPIVWHAAAGGVGLIACQWAAALGLRVIATAGSKDKCELALAHGAWKAIDYCTEDVVARVKGLTAGRGVEVVYDSVGKDTWERSLDCLAPFGVLVSFGNASGPPPPFEVGALMRKGSLYVTRPTLATFTTTREETQTAATELFAMVTSGRIAVPAPRTYALADAAQAHRDLEARATTGASVLVP